MVDAGVLVGAGMSADAGMLDEVGKVSVDVKAVAVLDSLAIWDGEVVLMALASLRTGPWPISTNIALSQQPASAAGVCALALQQNSSVADPLTRGHGIMALKLSSAAITLSGAARNLLGKTWYHFCSSDNMRRHSR